MLVFELPEIPFVSRHSEFSILPRGSRLL
jgi:hypothetical protein